MAANIEKVMLDHVLTQIDRKVATHTKRSWVTSIVVWVAVGVSVFLVTSRYGSKPGAQVVFLIAAFAIGAGCSFAVFKAWQSSVWETVVRYVNVDAIRARVAELK